LIPKEFNEWWNAEGALDKENPFIVNTPAFWAWEGWYARDELEKKLDKIAQVC
jgi:hypothetical protein